ncbi:MAG: magnetochrome domain-containing protein [Polyangiaceae bacterium]|nr:magnetochrome domain-containing protein [Polyangiaceae bacterium]
MGPTTCASCHTITDARGVAVPPIHALSPLPHTYRGVCVNCHTITTRPQAPAAQPAAYACPIQPVAAVAPAAPGPAAPVATEGEWLGLEVAPISPLTATQFKLPEGTFGLIVVEAEAQAATLGLKPGDVLVGVNGSSVGTMTDFFAATQNGTLTEADVQVMRRGQPLSLRLSATAPAPAPRAAAATAPALRVQP